MATRRAAVLGAALALSACVAAPGAQRQATGLNEPAPLDAAAPSLALGRRVAVLLPLNGPMASVGQAMLKGVQLSLAASGSPRLLVEDTGGTPDGAAKAARTALSAGAGLILGPLTTRETAAVGPVAQAAGVPVLAFTSDQAQARPGVWVLGITPAQQVRRLLGAVQTEGKTRVTAVLPQNDFGDALATGLLGAAREANMPEPRIVRTGSSFAALNDAMKDASGYTARRASPDVDGKPTAPPPMDALFLGLNGDQLGQAVPLLSFYDVPPGAVRVLGPATWAQLGGRQPALSGAWYAAPDPAARSGFEAQYTAKYSAPASDFSSLAYDVAGIARANATRDGFPLGPLTRVEGYNGANGLLALRSDGQVRRGLAIFEIDRGGAHIVQPAPSSFAAPGT